MAKKGNLSIPWPFESMNIRLNTDTGLLKLIAIVTMLVEHIDTYIVPPGLGNNSGAIGSLLLAVRALG